MSVPSGSAAPLKAPDQQLDAKPVIFRVDNVADENDRRQIYEFLNGPGWTFGWRSSSKTDIFSFWNKHFVGIYNSEAELDAERQTRPDLAPELEQKFPLLFSLWRRLQETILKDHILVRCYANGLPFGCEGSVHTDSSSPRSFTTVYYPSEIWSPNWGGETVLFNQDATDSIASIYPRPNRAAMFRGNIPHVARGVSRVCPLVRITLMFKSEIPK